MSRQSRPRLTKCAIKIRLLLTLLGLLSFPALTRGDTLHFDGGVSSISFTEASHCVTHGTPLTLQVLQNLLIITADRNGGPECLGPFRGNLTDKNMIPTSSAGATSPSDLNFAVTGSITLTYGSTGQTFVLADVRIGEGHYGAHNNWWFASSSCEMTGPQLLCACDTGGSVWIGGGGDAYTFLVTGEPTPTPTTTSSPSPTPSLSPSLTMSPTTTPSASVSSSITTTPTPTASSSTLPTASSELGRGGYARVYAGMYREAIPIVLKVPFDDSEETREIFRREGEIQASLDHPFILPVLGFCERGVQRKIVLVLPRAATSLNSVLENGTRLSLRWRLKALYQVTAGLAALHSAAIVHADLKAFNILLSQRPGEEDSRCLLTDFGISRAMNVTVGGREAPNRPLIGRTPAGQAGGIQPGSHRWKAPELFENPVSRPTYASDVYAWGIVAWELLNRQGDIPYSDIPDELIRIVVLDQRRRPDLDLLPGVPPALITLIQEAWAHEPASRPRDGNALLARLIPAITQGEGGF